MKACLVWFCLGIGFAASFTAVAFDPPVGVAGPLTIRIEAPEKITQTNAPQSVHVRLENALETTLSGVVRLGVIDDWSVDPASRTAFEVPGKGDTSLDFVVTVGPETLNAVYPIHAYADFESAEGPLTAHAVALVRTEVPPLPRPVTEIEWRTIEVAPDSAVSLSEVPCYRPMIGVFGETPRPLPVAWRGVDGATRTSLDPAVAAGQPDPRRCFAIHPPWFGGQAGSVWFDYRIQLPETGPIVLRFANAIRTTYPPEPPSDGVTFRVRTTALDAPEGTLGEILFERHTDARIWQDAEIDLSRFAGQSIVLQFETHPGPNNNTTCDGAYWASPLIVAGNPDSAADAPKGPPVDLGTVRAGDADYGVQVTPGVRGLLDARVSLSRGDKALWFNGFHVSVLGEALESPSAASRLEKTADESQNGSLQVRHCFDGPHGTFDLMIAIDTRSGTAPTIRFWLENTPAPRPWFDLHIDDFALGPWSAVATRVYAGTGNVLQDPGPFTMGFDGHRLATSFVGFEFADAFPVVLASSLAPERLEVDPAARRYTLHTPLSSTFTLIPAPSVWAGARHWHDVNGLQASVGVESLAGRFVFDLWGGNYGPSAAELERAFAYGLTDSVVVWHNWQRWGYDYRLPDICPPNPHLGTLEEFQALCDTCKENGVIFAPHDNYIDFYPDAEGFSYDKIGFTQSGEPIWAWLNEGRGAQAFRWSALEYEPFLQRNLKIIRDSIAPTGFFIDVWSSIGPYDSWTRDGSFVGRDVVTAKWGGSFAWIRDYLGGAPQISESGHDQLIGYLDGAQANHLRVGRPGKDMPWMVWDYPCVDAERVPWFDAAHHDRFVLHGAGYESRYAAGLHPALHGIYSDDYMCTEVLTGHPAMVSRPFGRDVVRKYWLLHDLMRAIALDRIQDVQFVENDLHRQHVVWEGGAQVWVNRGPGDWAVEGHVLPEYGFYARAGEVEAAIERRDGVIVEWSQGPSGVYANARPVVGDVLPVSARVTGLTWLGEGRFRADFEWDAEKPLPQDMVVFVHCVDGEGKIRFQADHPAPVPTSQWQGIVPTTGYGTVPADIRPGESFELRVGFHIPQVGRFAFRGLHDEERRSRLGTVTVQGDNGTVSGLDWSPVADEKDPVLERMNPEGRLIDFGDVRTDGGFRLVRRDGGWTLTPLPDSPPLQVALAGAGASVPMAPVARAGESAPEEPIPCQEGLWTLPCGAGIFAYELNSPAVQ